MYTNLNIICQKMNLVMFPIIFCGREALNLPEINFKLFLHLFSSCEPIWRSYLRQHYILIRTLRFDVISMFVHTTMG